MNIPNTQISAYISKETKILVEQYVKSRGIKKAFLIESALLHHLQALKDLPRSGVDVYCRQSCSMGIS